MKHGLVSLAIGFFLSACSPGFDSRTPAPPVVSSPTQPPAVHAVQAAQARIRSDLADGNFPAALARIRREVVAGAPESRFAAEYPEALNGTLAAAGSEQEAGRFAEAGQLQRQALDAFPADPDLAGRMTAAPAAILASLQICTERLMEQGLLAYRAGRLEEAIDTWKQLLSFHPDYQPARKAVETASLQLRNLRTME